MELKQIEVEILTDIYNMCRNEGKIIDYRDYELKEKDNKQKIQKFAYYLLNLKNLGYVDFDENKVFAHGGKINEKYKNKVLMIVNPEKININKAGIEILEKIKK